MFTYFDIPEYSCDEEITNLVKLDGHVCKKDILRKTSTGKKNLHIILANNIISDNNNYKLNNYIPIVFWGKLAKEADNLSVNDMIEIEGQLHSRNYSKLNSDTGEYEIKVAHEVIVTKFKKVVN